MHREALGDIEFDVSKLTPRTVLASDVWISKHFDAETSIKMLSSWMKDEGVDVVYFRFVEQHVPIEEWDEDEQEYINHPPVEWDAMEYSARVDKLVEHGLEFKGRWYNVNSSNYVNLYSYTNEH